MKNYRSCSYLHPQTHTFYCTECGQSLDLCLCPDPSQQAEDRLHSPQGLFLTQVNERIASDRLSNAQNEYLLARLIEALGKFSHNLRGLPEAQETDHRKTFQSAVQVGVLLARIATEGEQDFHYEPERLFGEKTPV